MYNMDVCVMSIVNNLLPISASDSILHYTTAPLLKLVCSANYLCSVCIHFWSESSKESYIPYYRILCLQYCTNKTKKTENKQLARQIIFIHRTLPIT